MKRIGILSVAFAMMLTIGCRGNNRDADANRPADTPAVGTAGERTADRDREAGMLTKNWVKDRLLDGMTEVKLGELAGQKAQNADVKAFARMLVQDHTKAGDELKQAATKHNIETPAELDDDHRDKLEKFSKTAPNDFDREYINAMVDDHEKTVKALEDHLDKEGTDENPRYTPKKTDNVAEADINQWAAQAIPTVREHLAKAKALDQKLNRRTTDR